MKWAYMILILICFGIAAYGVTINHPYSTLWVVSSVIYAILFAVELICDKIDNLYKKISNNTK